MNRGVARRLGLSAATRVVERFSRSISEFLAIPIFIVVGFFALAIVLSIVDHDAGTQAHWSPLRSFLGRYVGNGSTAGGLLTTIAGSLITVTSITFSILLLAVQQGASALTSQIIDHYLRRPSNRVYFGFFVGTSVFALVTLVLTTPQSRPVLGATFATIFACVALFVLILLIYSTIDQIRPGSVIATIHDAALSSRVTQRDWLARTAPCTEHAGDGAIVASDRNGYLARVRVKDLTALVQARPGCTIAILPSVGAFVAHGTPIASVSGVALDDMLERAVRRALPIDEQRDIGCDAAASVDHLVNIAWTAISTAKSNPAVGMAACQSLKDILYRWTGETEAVQAPAGAIRYHDDAPAQLLDAFETLMIAASESMQHQSLAIIMDSIALAFGHSTAAARDRMEQILLTSVAALGDHLPTRALETSFARTVAALHADGRQAGADRLAAGWTRLAATRGEIRSRGNRDAA